MQGSHPPAFTCNAYLDELGVMRDAYIRYDGENWLEFRVGVPLSGPISNGYIVPMLPVEFHCHGIGMQDFSEFESLDLEQINQEARREGIFCVLCIFLSQSKLDAFFHFMHSYAKARREGRLTHIVGIGLEGPLLSSFGGTPEQGTWLPTRLEWEKLAACRELGLEYTVLSPDAMLGDSKFAGLSDRHYPDLQWIVSLLVEAKIRLALGHFQKSNPRASAQCIDDVLRVVNKKHCQPFDRVVLTDHLFNDMPLKFRHAWRTPKDKLRRAEEIKELHLDCWKLENLEEKVGEVPAALIRAAHDGAVSLCINFDGSHVDLAVCQRVIELIGTDSIIAMTDRIDTNTLGGQVLEKRKGTNLWYQAHGIVAAGSSSINHQMNNLRTLNISEAAIWKLTSFNPSTILGISPTYNSARIPIRSCYVSNDGSRSYIESSEPDQAMALQARHQTDFLLS